MKIIERIKSEISDARHYLEDIKKCYISFSKEEIKYIAFSFLNPFSLFWKYVKINPKYLTRNFTGLAVYDTYEQYYFNGEEVYIPEDIDDGSIAGFERSINYVKNFNKLKNFQ